MRIRKPRHASQDEVKLSWDGDYAVIEFADPTISTTRLKIGSRIGEISDQEFLDLFNGTISAMDQLAAEYENVVIEIPPGQSQIQYSEITDRWTPRGDVIRCYVEDGGPDGELTVHIDQQELSLREFGRLLVTYSGWGMRIAFVPDDMVDEEPTVEVREPREGER